MKKIYYILLMVTIWISLVCGCVGKSNYQPPNLNTAPTTPLPQYRFNIMEPASDGNLNVTVLGTADGNRLYGSNNEKQFLIKIKLENLRTDKKIQVMGSDFQLTSSDYVFRPTFLMYNLDPGKSGETTLEYSIPQDSKNLELKFDFSGTSGVGKGGKVVYFIL